MYSSVTVASKTCPLDEQNGLVLGRVKLCESDSTG